MISAEHEAHSTTAGITATPEAPPSSGRHCIPPPPSEERGIQRHYGETTEEAAARYTVEDVIGPVAESATTAISIVAENLGRPLNPHELRALGFYLRATGSSIVATIATGQR